MTKAKGYPLQEIRSFLFQYRYLAIIIFIALGYFVLVSNGFFKPDGPSTSHSQVTDGSIKPKASSSSSFFGDVPIRSQTYNFTYSVLTALISYHVASNLDAKEDWEIVDYMTGLLNSNNYLNEGDLHIQNYTSNSNEVIQLAAKGMLLGSSEVKKANNDLIAYLRQNNLNDFDYATAAYLSEQKKGYLDIAIAAPQIGYLFFEPAKSNNPTGLIPYRISKEERVQILRDIDNKFGKELADYERYLQNPQGSYNSIIFTVYQIRKQLLPETYEEGKALDDL